MPCESYKDALIEAAATGAGPQGELRAHLAECASCRAAFEQEQSLFTAIDSGLGTTTNGEVPPSLLPRVRASLDEVAVVHPPRWLQSLVFASSTVMFAFMVFLIAGPHHAAPEDVARQGPVVTPAPKTPATKTNSEKTASKASQSAAVRVGHSHAGRSSTIPHAVTSSNLEVLVSPDEREAFARLVATLNARNGVAAAFLAHAPEKEGTLVSVDPLQIPDIEIKPLEGAEAETSAGASQKR